MFTTEKEFYQAIATAFGVAVVVCYLVGLVGDASPLMDYLRGM